VEVASCGATAEDNESRLFSTFCPKAIGLKGTKLPDTTFSRPVVIELTRRLPGERAKSFRYVDDEEFATLRRKLARWAGDSGERLAKAEPVMPNGFENRLAANWHLLFAIADLAGGSWPKTIRKAAEAFAKTEFGTSRGVELLADIRRAFVDSQQDRMSSVALIGMLVSEQDRPWSEWSRGKPLTQRQLAGLLKDFKIFPPNVRLADGTTPKGYQLASFEDAFRLAKSSSGSNLP
jgi:putative DNA primase/helicase